MEIQYRGKARIVACIEVVLSGLAVGLLSLIVLVISASFFLPEVNPNQLTVNETDSLDSDEPFILKDFDSSIVKGMTINALMYFALELIIASIELYIGLALLHATKMESDLQDALQKATMWRNWYVVLSVVSVMDLAMSSHMYSILVTLLIRALFLYIVHKFIQGLDSAINLMFLPPPVIKKA